MTTIAPFGNHLPVRIRFGEGVAGELGDVAANEGAGRAVVVIDDGLEEQSAQVAAAVGSLTAAGVETIRHVKAAGEPSGASVDAAAGVIRDAGGRTAVVAIGGGSVIDTAKAARACAQAQATFAGFLAAGCPFQDAALPLIVLPTTAGTGSEVSGGAVITDEGTGRKAGIADPRLRAQHALVDPALTWSVPPAMTAYTGVDALAQAIAAIVARTRTPIGDAIALEAIRLIGSSLVAAFRDGGDHEARAAMACGSLMAGLAMNISDCAAEHSLAQAIGGERKAPHGLTVGLVLAETLERERAHVPELLERVADALGAGSDGSRDGSRAVAAVRGLLAELDFPVLASVGVEAADIPRLAELALADHFITQSPVPWSDGEVRQAFERALAITAR